MWHVDRCFSEYFGFPLSISLHQRSILISYQKGKPAKPGNLPKSKTLSEIEQNGIEKYFYSNAITLERVTTNYQGKSEKMLYLKSAVNWIFSTMFSA